MRTTRLMRLTLWMLCTILTHSLYAQEQRSSVRGIVRNEKGEALAFVNVQIKNEQNSFTAGAQSDSAGVFRFSQLEPGSNYTFTFSYVGFSTQELTGYTLKPGGTLSLVVKMKENVKTMDELVVIGYGSQKREVLTSAVSTVKSKDFVKGAVTDAAQLIRGKVPGLAVITPDGNPTAVSQFSMRGVNSINASGDPLVLIDGIPGALTMIAPEDIEQIDVLKDGSAAAIYGTRGTNGVILISTKKAGKNIDPTLDINSYVSTQAISKKLQFMTPSQYRELVAQNKPGAMDYGANTNWLDEITQSPLSQVHSATLRAGTASSGYIASMEYRDQNGIIQRSNNRIFYPRLSIYHTMFDNKLRIDANLMGFQQTMNALADGGSYRSDIYRNALTYNPTDPVRGTNGLWTQHTDKTDYANPVSLIEETIGNNKNSRFRTYGTISYLPFDGLELKLLGSHDIYNSVRGYYETKQHISTVRDGRNGFASRGTTRTREDQVDFTAQYSKSIQNHSFSVLGGWSWREYFSEDYWMQNWDFPTDQFSFNHITSGLALARGQAAENSYAEESRLISFFGRVTYNYKQKYMLMASLRREGSTKFGEDHKWGSYPAVSIGWNIFREDFMQDVKAISNLKLRAGYGVTGTEPSTPYTSLKKINFDGYTYINGQWIQVISPGNNPNPDLRWETKREWNFGLDWGILNERISGSIDLYKRTTHDLILWYPVPSPPYIFNTINANAATMENKGIELQVNGVPVQTKNFQWTTGVNYASNRNLLVSLSNENFTSASGFMDAGATGEPIQTFTHRLQIGHPVGNFFGYKSIDIDAQGRWIIEDQDGKPKPIAQQTPNDKKVLGNGLPKHYLNWNNSFTYKKFDLNIGMRGAFGFQILNMAEMFYSAPVMLARGNVMQSTYDDIYGKRPLADNQELQYVSQYIQKGDYWKIDNVTLGYSLDLNRKNFKYARLYASVSNLAVITGYSGIDPEVSIGGLAPGIDDRNRYPAVRTFTLGTFLTF